jgi:hypothetical protein
VWKCIVRFNRDDIVVQRLVVKDGQARFCEDCCLASSRSLGWLCKQQQQLRVPGVTDDPGVSSSESYMLTRVRQRN